ncbi:MAG: excinuclease ABC subunit UvrA [Bacteroidales bacterium]|jgi:excinuclease UvrABC ATPase subunit|nr:excinuclease ABC subunit UvrA [Bacteroidales bacterium]MCI2121765.1 excinuclease ABC subunit UvrA [Bacteroidales bacterium]MCI2145906.1 excinuclease ABC subunit UvrA [Bacteroidales bacterium]
MDRIKIFHACENNLKDISLEIPKKRITVFTGVSGSGKTSLCLDTIAAESRRELNDTFPSFVQQYLPKYGRPKVERIENLPVTILIEQKKPSPNSRSTVGTYTDIYALLRLLFSRVGKPFIGYSDCFSFNHPAGSCPRCGGLGTVTDLDIHKLVDFDKCLNDVDVIHFPTFTTGAWRWKRYAYSGLFDLDKKIRNYSREELDLFLYSPQVKLKDPPPNWPKSAKFEGIYPRMYRSIIPTKEGKRQKKVLDLMACTTVCPECHGTRVNARVRSCLINGRNIAEVVDMPISEAVRFVASVEDPLAPDLKEELYKRLKALEEIGLGYISLSRATGTLSGGEAQRIKIAKYINSALTDMAYVLDEPSAGLHPQDISRMQASLRGLRDHGNSVMIVEHNRDIISMADHIVDVGPAAGSHGGEIMFQGDYEGLLSSATVTGRMLRQHIALKDEESPLRTPSGFFHVEHATLHNLKDVAVDLPKGVLTVIAGVAGSGKSSLMEYFQTNYCPEAVFIGQKDIGINMRSTPATYLGISDTIRLLFAKENGVSSQLFSFNSLGACPACKGKGIIVSDMAFMESIETVCDVCHGTRYSGEALKYKFHGRNIAEVMDMSVEEAYDFFMAARVSLSGNGVLFGPRLQSLMKVGLGYLHLNQAMTTLSGGELQRVKLASQLYRRGDVFILDEPTDGLHLDDVRKLLDLFNEMTDSGNTLYLIEHSLDVMAQADYIVEIGPGGGDDGGELIFSGTPRSMLSCAGSVTAPFLRAALDNSQ